MNESIDFDARELLRKIVLGSRVSLISWLMSCEMNVIAAPCAPLFYFFLSSTRFSP